MSDSQWVQSLRMPFLNGQAAIQCDPQICAGEIAQVLTINDYLPLGEVGQFRYRSAALQVGELTLTTVCHTSVSLSAPVVTTATATFILPYAGMAVSYGQGHPIAYMPGQAVMVSRGASPATIQVPIAVSPFA